MRQVEINITEVFSGRLILAHFTSSEIGIQKILYANKLRFSDYLGQSDPFEKAFKKLTISGPQKILNGGNDSVLLQIVKAQADLLKFYDKIKVLCFASSNASRSATGFCEDTLPILNPKMWIEFGNKQSGMCLLFDHEKLTEELSNLVNTKHCDFVKYKPMRELKESRPDVSIREYLRLGKDEFMQIQKEKIIRSMVFEKHLSFFNEQEFRMCVIGEQGKDLYIDISKSLTGIVLTPKTEQFYCEYLADRFRSTDVGIFMVNWDSREVALRKFEF